MTATRNNPNELSSLEKERYSRHLIIPEIGEEGQKKLKNSKVLVIGAGGLGGPILQYLVAAGIGTIGIVEPDLVSLSNLQRQILYTTQDENAPKAEIARERLLALNSNVNIETYQEWLTVENAKEILEKYEMVVGTTDNFKSRYLIDEFSFRLGIPFIHGSISEFEGQVAIFNHKDAPRYNQLYPESPNENAHPMGVMGVLPGIIGSLMACEVIKLITGIGNTLSGKLLIYNALECNFTKISLKGLNKATI